MKLSPGSTNIKYFLQDNFPLSLEEDPFFKEARESFEKVRERMKAETDEFWRK